MTTMLEKAARALFDSYVRLSDVGADEAEPYWLAQKEGFVSSARAALQAIKEPDIETAMLGGTVIPLSGYEATDCAERAFTAMIDAILNEKP